MLKFYLSRMSNKWLNIDNLKVALNQFYKRLFLDRSNGIIILYGILLSALVFTLKFFEYRYFIRDLSVEFYIGIVATLFTAIGIWVGLKLVNKNSKVSDQVISVNHSMIKSLKISRREYEVLELISKGLSNQEIADSLFISLPTVKTHSSNLFEKLNVKRRTQAILKAKELEIIA